MIDIKINHHLRDYIVVVDFYHLLRGDSKIYTKSREEENSLGQIIYFLNFVHSLNLILLDA